MDLLQGQTYSFNTIADPVLGEHTNAILVAEGGLLVTKCVNIDVMNLGDRVIAYSGPSNINMQDKTFFIFKDVATGNHTVVAKDWIVDNTLRQTAGNNYIIRLSNMPSDRLSGLHDAIRQLLPAGVSMNISNDIG